VNEINQYSCKIPVDKAIPLHRCVWMGRPTHCY